MTTLMKFGDMPYGQWFRETGNKRDRRRFIKLQNILPSGIEMEYRTFCTKDKSYPDGSPMCDAGKLLHTGINAIDIDGIGARCPDWVVFELIKPPFKQRVQHNHTGDCRNNH